MKRLTMKLFLTFAAVCAWGSALQAQSYRMSADVPFAFHLGASSLPAGAYQLEKPLETQVQSMITPSGRRVLVGLAGNLFDSRNTPRLVFHRYGNEYFLSEIWNGKGSGTKLKPTASENSVKETAAANTARNVTIAMAGLR